VKVIVVYASAGSGHFKSAQALYNCLKQEPGNLDVRLIDALDYSNVLFKNAYIFGYVFLVNYAHWLWSLAFFLTYAKPLRRIIQWMRFVTNRLNTRRFARLLIRENPDFIISTHFLPAEVSSHLKRNKKINSRLITVITDFGVHPFWVAKDTDTYIVASDFTKGQLSFEGVGKDCIKVSGIPIDLKFLKQHKKELLCEKFGIHPDLFTVLVVTGSFGIGPIEEIVDLLHGEAQLLVVCAKNRKLYARLKNKDYPGVKIFGFIDNIQELMAVSDMVITKPGGLTISEVLAMELVPIFVSAIPGQERENMSVLKRFGIGWEIKDAEKIKDAVLDYKASPDRLKSIKEKIKRIKKPFATQELCRVICQDSAGASC
jgi:processive 1,2-diacylglycerol beta-glucosyltransferase